ncbi:hypothetical protein BCR44DRAFT_1511931 [Catenaria anguillulae PL171]|uniref:DSC E3 ubiquitin ligase complex subunit 3 C-terminal domain-containing protein n=1 Tax=Catenaria anguillulae PL171 TaxID=765915 RepID=A0A1Y2HS04_9FUNG|nr:hypothetical protein BCR44DRAFT_1511931 [Catenaria anguillulae PL171]
MADLLAAIRSQYASSSQVTTPLIPLDRVRFKLLHAGSVLVVDTQPLAHLKRQLLVTHSPMVSSQAITLPSTTQPIPASTPIPPPQLEPQPAALFSLEDDDDEPIEHDDENTPLHPDSHSPPTQSTTGSGGVSPRPDNERLPLLLRAPSASVPASPSKHLPASSSPRVSPDSANLIETIVVLCSISEAMPDADVTSESQPVTPSASSSNTPRGFDALLTQGFSPDDIQAFRRTFHQARGTASASEPDRLRLEDAWVAGDHSNDQAQVASTEQSTVKALVKGAALGYFLGVPMVLGVKEVARLDRRVVVGGVLGLVVNFGVGVLLWINQG